MKTNKKRTPHSNWFENVSIIGSVSHQCEREKEKKYRTEKNYLFNYILMMMIILEARNGDAGETQQHRQQHINSHRLLPVFGWAPNEVNLIILTSHLMSHLSRQCCSCCYISTAKWIHRKQTALINFQKEQHKMKEDSDPIRTTVVLLPHLHICVDNQVRLQQMVASLF